MVHGRIWLEVVDVWLGVSWDPEIAGERLGVFRRQDRRNDWRLCGGDPRGDRSAVPPPRPGVPTPKSPANRPNSKSELGLTPKPAPPPWKLAFASSNPPSSVNPDAGSSRSALLRAHADRASPTR